MGDHDLKMRSIDICSDIEDFFESYNLGEINDEDEIIHYITKIEDIKKEFRRVHAQLKNIEGNEFQTKYPDFEKQLGELNEFFQMSNKKLRSLKKQKIQAIEEANREAEADRVFKEKAEADNKKEELLVCAESLKYEIGTRCDTLRLKCNVDVSKLNDHEVLDLRKREDYVHAELRELIDKVSDFEKFVLPCGNLAQELVESVQEMRGVCLTEVLDYSKAIKTTISERDISEKKLENSAGLSIDIPRFKGYHGDVDIYTLRREFEKLVEPNVQKNLWVDYLKKNCLAGTAFNLVSKMNDIDDIWTKLVEVFGNTQLLFQNKLSALKKFSNLEKLKDDEKIAYSLTSLINLMAELSDLAARYDLEGDLYHGGGMQKILECMGEQRERKFIRSIAKGNLKTKAKWDRLVAFLNEELVEREAFIINNKAKQSISSNRESRDQKDMRDNKDSNGAKKSASNGFLSNSGDSKAGGSKCTICGKSDGHIKTVDQNNEPVIEYISCKFFVDLTTRERDQLLFKKRLCKKCLKPGVKWNSDHKCDQTYLCKQPYVTKSGENKTCANHVLVCGFHCKEKKNQDLLETFKKNVIKANTKYADFTKEINICNFSEIYGTMSNFADIAESSVFAFQTIDIQGMKINIFYDSGCGDLVVRKDTIDKLVKIGVAKKEHDGPITLNGVGNQTSICEHGIYSVCLPLKDGNEAKMSGVCVTNVTLPFPKYPLGTVEDHIRKEVAKSNYNLLPKLPKLPVEVGGEVDVMIGKHYLRYFPLEIARLESGLTLYESMFLSADGSTGIVSGPHEEFSKIDRASHFVVCEKLNYYSPATRKYFNFLSYQSPIPLLGCKKNHLDSDFVNYADYNICQCCENVPLSPKSPSKNNEEGANDFGNPFAGGNGVEIALDPSAAFASKRGPRCLKSFEVSENAGTDISYRCVDCRNCAECKKGSSIEEISIREEYEQNLIDKSVSVDPETNTSTAFLPFLDDPDKKLCNNIASARNVYNKVTKSLAKSPDDREMVIKAEEKLQKLGFVDWLENLPKEEQDLIKNGPVNYYIPWRVVWSASLSTPVRPVFDASMRPAVGHSLNEILPKGQNNMNNLTEILIRWSIKLHAYHSDISKCYNGVKIDKSHWRYQLYLFQDELDPSKEPNTKVIKTVIYGVRPSGNQAERALRLTADMNKDIYPLAYDTIHDDLYVDDCISGEDTLEARNNAAEQLQLCLSKGGFSLKGITISGHDPDESLSKDGKSINTAGFKWFPKGDFIMYNVDTLNFAKKIRGRKLEIKPEPPPDLTMRDCVSMIAQVFDPTGRLSPIIASWKMDISQLHKQGLSWDDVIPDNLRSIWVSNFEMMSEISNIKYRRAVVPPDAKNLDIMTIDAADASSTMICAAIYARFERKNGEFSCQLLFARTKVVPEGISIPRAELMAAHMNAATGHVVKRALGSYHKRSIKLTDSIVALSWIGSKSALKTWVRTRVIEINRLSDYSEWRYVETKNMIADIGTRRGAKISDITDDSKWIKGYEWMSLPEKQFPLSTLADVQVKRAELDEVEKEKIIIKSFFANKEAEISTYAAKQIESRYNSSDYLIDPNRFRFRKILRVTSLILGFIYKISVGIPRVRENKVFQHDYPGKLADHLLPTNDKYLLTTNNLIDIADNTSESGKVIIISDEMMKSAFYYFSLKASDEVKKFLEKKKYCDISKEIDGVLYYSGRIMGDVQFKGYPELCQEAIDLCPSSFCVPVMDQYSPVAISIALEVHWYHPDVRHSGIESMLRLTESIAHIIGGRNLVKCIKHGCKMCRILHKKSVDVVMGPLQNINLCIAPPFYACQVDIFGPFKSYSSANKRATLKIWFTVFCCCTTGAVDIRAMEDYSTESFVQSFIRFSCRFGYSRYILPDAGSQLVKGCETMKYTFIDTKQILSKEYGVEYIVCPVGAHYNHGKVERKIREIKKSVHVHVINERLSQMQWETLMQQIANSINNHPIGIRNKTEDLENLDLITPNRLILGRNNERCPNAPVRICNDHRSLIDQNARLFKSWFKAWLISYLPLLVERQKWHTSGREILVGDIVLFLKSEKEFDEQYQYGLIKSTFIGQDGHVRKVEVEYRNSTEGAKRTTTRGAREIVVIFPVDELDVYETLAQIID